MNQSDARSAKRPEFDQIIQAIADYVCDYEITSNVARETARYCLMDSMGCMLQALDFPECTKLLGPIVPGAELTNGVKVPGTSYQLDPVQAAFNIGTLVRWLDFNDTWLAAEWGHPSDNIGAILSTADYLSRRNLAGQTAPLTVGDVLEGMIKAHEIQGVLALENSFNQVGLDHVLLVRVASTAVVTQMLGGTRQDVLNAVSNAWLDGGALRTYRHAPNTGSRKSWAAGDAARRAVQLSLMAVTGEMGYPSALSAKTWGFYDVLFNGKLFEMEHDFASYVMENVLFKIAFPAEFHAQTAVEAAITLHPQVAGRLDEIQEIRIETQEAGARIIDKTGPLANPADRDHCLQYMVAIGLIFGNLTAAHYEDDVASDERIDRLRAKMKVSENPEFTQGYFDPERRAIGNALEIVFEDGSRTERVAVEYPIGHKRRREEGIPLLKDKFERSLTGRLSRRKCAQIKALVADARRLEATPVNEFTDLFAL